MLPFYRSGTEEEYTEFDQLLEYLSSYRRDMQELKDMKAKGRERKKEKELQTREKGTQMREAALIGMTNRKHITPKASKKKEPAGYL
ncbi:Hypothetical predicted protein [Paramuricea clavata]|uniref:Uncharacterized protein n=1 Tax=Paramuricea clavata TaxID=317549 RepID=A0A6S7FMX3_PARCT|nr:Hypothetical predicted protein [Paramuricea clavata]